MNILARQVLICQNRTCRKQGSYDVKAAFEVLSGKTVKVSGCGCLGQCGNGPMVLILPETIWLRGVTPQKVATIVQQYLSIAHAEDEPQSSYMSE